MEIQKENVDVHSASSNTQDSSSNYKTPSYTLRAIRKYQEKNKDKINSKWRERYENDPEFREKQKQKSKLKYEKKKQFKNNSNI
jgi:hypothetical protein